MKDEKQEPTYPLFSTQPTCDPLVFSCCPRHFSGKLTPRYFRGQFPLSPSLCVEPVDSAVRSSGAARAGVCIGADTREVNGGWSCFAAGGCWRSCAGECICRLFSRLLGIWNTLRAVAAYSSFFKSFMANLSWYDDLYSVWFLTCVQIVVLNFSLAKIAFIVNAIYYCSCFLMIFT